MLKTLSKMNKPLKALFLLVFALDLASCSHVIFMHGSDSERSVSIQKAEPGLTYSNKTDSHSEFHYIYTLTLGTFPPRTMRLRTEVTEESIRESGKATTAA